MRSYLHTIKQHQAYIEKLSLWIKIKQKDLEARINHTPAFICCTKEGAQLLHISIKNHNTQTVYLPGFDITWQTAPSQR